MRSLVLTVALLLGALSPLPALATALGPPAATYVFGTLDAPPVSETNGNKEYTCTLVNTIASSEMRSNGLGAVTFSMSDPIQYFNNVALYTYGSYATMTFASASTGTIRFIREIVDSVGTKPIVQTFDFVSYTQEFKASTETLTLSFTIDFPNCPLAVSGIYQQ